MEERELNLNLGMLCNRCNHDSYELPHIEGLPDSQRKEIEELCKLCVESFKRRAVNA
jgi:hypothetical protein